MRRWLWRLLAALSGLRVLEVPPHSIVVLRVPMRLSAEGRVDLKASLNLAAVEPTAAVCIFEGGLEVHAVIRRPRP